MRPNHLMNMSSITYRTILAFGKAAGWLPDMAENEDRYKKIITFTKGHKSICIHKDIGISKGGVVKYLKVVVHPRDFDQARITTSELIAPAINRITKENGHRHSGYQNFLHDHKTESPLGKAFRLSEVGALEEFFPAFG